MNNYSPFIDRGKCTGCGQCAAACSHGAISIAGGIAASDPTLCRGCGVCAEVCPSGAISMLYPARDVVAVEARPTLPVAQAGGEVAVPFDTIRSPEPHSLLARAAKVVAPAVLNLAIAVGQAWLDRTSDAGSSKAAWPNRPSGTRRRIRRRGR